MIHKTRAVRSLLRFIVAALVLGLVVPVAFIVMVLVSWTLMPIIDRAKNQRDFDQTVWMASDGYEMRSPRGYMLDDVEDFLDDEPTVDQVLAKLGPSEDRGYDDMSYYIGFQHSFMPIDPYTLELQLENGRVVEYYLAQH